VVEPSPKEPTAADVANAPPTGSESGRLDVEPGDSPARDIAQTLLMFPKAVVYVVDAPVRGALWTYDRYDLKDRYYDFFYNKTHTLGIVPTGSFVSGFGVTIGARAIAKNYFGYGEYAY